MTSALWGLLPGCGRREGSSGHPDQPGDAVRRFEGQAYVTAHLREAFLAERLAGIAGVSPRSIARLFVRELGVTPHDFVEAVRIDRARNLLEATELALKAVAFECGFARPDHRRSAFQRRLGVPRCNTAKASE